jgi:hypothetical protein
MSTLDLQQVIQIAVTAPFLLTVFKDCVIVLAAMHGKEGAHQSMARDTFFLFAIFLCVTALCQSWLKTIIAFKTDMNEDNDGGNMLVYIREKPEAAKTTGSEPARDEEKDKACKKNTESEGPVPASPQPVKQSTTPPLVNESNGPKED